MGGQAVPHFDYCMAPYVQKTYDKEYKKAYSVYNELKGTDVGASEYAEKKALESTNKETYQAMEALVHNFNTLHSRAGAQVN